MHNFKKWHVTTAILAPFLSPMFLSAQSSVSGLTVAKGYSITVFSKGTGKFTAPDSLAVTRDRVYIGFGDGNDPAGLDGKATQIIEYTTSGQQLNVYNVPGHNDGLKVDPSTGKIWAMQNEDGNPNLVIIDPSSREQRQYLFSTPPPHGGGYDDIVFLNGKVYFSASNPANDPNNKPAIVEGKITGSTVDVSAAFMGNALAEDVITGATVKLNLQDPDSMTVDAYGDIILDSQADSELVLVRNVSTRAQSALVIPLSSSLGVPQVDDTLIIPRPEGFLLVSDTPANTVYAIKKEFVPGGAYSAGVATPEGSSATIGFVAQLNLESGDLKPVISGLKSPHGLAYVSTAPVEEEQ